MTPYRLWVAWATVLLLAGLAGGAALPHDGAAGVTAERMRVMKEMAAQMKALGEMLRGPAAYDAGQARALAGSLHESCHTAAGQFPGAGHDHHSRAAPAVWEQRERFEAEMGALEIAVGDLVTATTSGPREAVAIRFAEVGRSCSSCHETFRLPDE